MYEDAHLEMEYEDRTYAPEYDPGFIGYDYDYECYDDCPSWDGGQCDCLGV